MCAPTKKPAACFRRGGLLVCSPNWTRTSNRSINSRMLCQLSYGGLLWSPRGVVNASLEPRTDSSACRRRTTKRQVSEGTAGAVGSGIRNQLPQILQWARRTAPKIREPWDTADAAAQICPDGRMEMNAACHSAACHSAAGHVDEALRKLAATVEPLAVIGVLPSTVTDCAAPSTVGRSALRWLQPPGDRAVISSRGPGARTGS